MCRLALEKFAAAEVAHKFAIARGDLAADGDDLRASLNLEAFKRIIIEIHLLGFRGDFAAMIWIVNNKVSVAAHFDFTFARIQTENLRRGGARRLDKAMHVDPP